MPPPKKVAAAKKADLPPIDIAEDVSTAQPADLKKITEMADRSAELQLLIDEENDYLKTLTDEKYRIDTVSLPEAMLSCGMRLFKTENGAGVALKDFVQSSLPAPGAIEKATGDEKVELQDRLDKGLAWIQEHNGATIIKSQILVDFEKGADKQKQEFFKAIKEKGYNAIAFNAVHPQTLQSWIKEKISSGITPPEDVFKIYSGTKAEVKLPVKAKKA